MTSEAIQVVESMELTPPIANLVMIRHIMKISLVGLTL